MEKLNDFFSKNFSQLRKDRAEAVAEEVELQAKRNVENYVISIRKNLRKRENVWLDIAPSNITSAKAVDSAFDAAAILDNIASLDLEIRNDRIKLTHALNTYIELFGEYSDMSSVKAVHPNYEPMKEAE